MLKIMKFKTVFICLLMITLATAVYQVIKMDKEIKSLKTNQETLLSDIEHYKINDSLNVAKIGSLTLSLNDYKKYRAEDAALIKKLKADKITAANKVNIESRIDSILVVVRDTLYMNTRVRAFDYKSKWTDISGIIMPDTVSISIANREELIITENCQKKKLWFIKLPAWLFGYKSRKIDIISKNPNTVVTDAEFIIIK